MPESEIEDIVDSLVQDEADDPEKGEADSGGTPPADPTELDSLKQRLSETQKAFHQLSEQNAHLRGQLEVINSQQPETPKVDMDKLKEDIREDPSKVLDILAEENRKLRQELAEVVVNSQRELTKTIRSTDPAHELIRSRIDSLRQHPDLADMDDETLERVARATIKRKRIPGPVGGGRSPTPAPRPEDAEVPDGALRVLMEGAGYNTEDK